MPYIKKLPADAGSISARMRRRYELCAGRPEIDGAFHPERVGSVIRTIAEVLHPFQIERAAGRYSNARDARTGTGTNDGGGAGSGAIACGQGKERNVWDRIISCIFETSVLSRVMRKINSVTYEVGSAKAEQA